MTNLDELEILAKAAGNRGVLSDEGVAYYSACSPDTVLCLVRAARALLNVVRVDSLANRLLEIDKSQLDSEEHKTLFMQFSLSSPKIVYEEARAAVAQLREGTK